MKLKYVTDDEMHRLQVLGMKCDQYGDDCLTEGDWEFVRDVGTRLIKSVKEAENEAVSHQG